MGPKWCFSGWSYSTLKTQNWIIWSFKGKGLFRSFWAKIGPKWAEMKFFKFYEKWIHGKFLIFLCGVTTARRLKIYWNNFSGKFFYSGFLTKKVQNGPKMKVFVLFWCYVSCYAMFSSFYKIFMNEIFLVFCLKSHSQKNEGLKLT